MKATAKKVVGRPFQPGQSGNPSGRRPAVLTKAIMAKLTPEKADALADVLFAEAESGESWAMNLIFERVEGKVPNKNEDGKPGDFDLDLSDDDRTKLRTALKVIRGGSTGS